MDDVVDLIEEAAREIETYGLKEMTFEIQDLAQILYNTVVEIERAIYGLRNLKNDALGSQNSIVKNQMEAHRSNASVVQASILKSLGAPISAKDVIRLQSLRSTLDKINKGTLNVNSLSGSPAFNDLNHINSQTLSNLNNIQINNPSVLLPPEGTRIEVGGVGSIGSPSLSLPEDPTLSLPTLGGTFDDPAAKLAKLKENLLKLQQAGQQIQQNLQQAGEKAKEQITQNLQKLQQAGQQIQKEAERRALELRMHLCKGVKPGDEDKFPNLKCHELNQDHDH